MNTCTIVTAAIAFLVLLMLFGGGGQSQYKYQKEYKIKKGKSCEGVKCTEEGGCICNKPRKKKINP